MKPETDAGDYQARVNMEDFKFGWKNLRFPIVMGIAQASGILYIAFSCLAGKIAYDEVSSGRGTKESIEHKIDAMPLGQRLFMQSFYPARSLAYSIYEQESKLK